MYTFTFTAVECALIPVDGDKATLHNQAKRLMSVPFPTVVKTVGESVICVMFAAVERSLLPADGNKAALHGRDERVVSERCHRR